MLSEISGNLLLIRVYDGREGFVIQEVEFLRVNYLHITLQTSKERYSKESRSVYEGIDGTKGTERIVETVNIYGVSNHKNNEEDLQDEEDDEIRDFLHNSKNFSELFKDAQLSDTFTYQPLAILIISAFCIIIGYFSYSFMQI